MPKTILKQGEHFIMCSYSDTVRLMPYNYVIAYKHKCGHWICDPDVALRLPLKMALFGLFTESHNMRWGSGNDLAIAFNTQIV